MKEIIITICICILLFVIGCSDCKYEYIGEIVDFEMHKGENNTISFAKVTTSENKIIIVRNITEGITPYNAFYNVKIGNKVYGSSVCNGYIIKRV